MSNVCTARDCIYGGRVSVASHICNYCTIEGKPRTVERIDGKVVWHHLIENGRCDLYRKRESDEEVDSDSDGLLDGSGCYIDRQGRGED